MSIVGWYFCVLPCHFITLHRLSPMPGSRAEPHIVSFYQLSFYQLTVAFSTVNCYNTAQAP